MKISWIVKNIMIISFSIIILISAFPGYSKVFAIINGTVKSEDGKPIEGAKVILVFSEDGSTFELTTDKNGSWRKVNCRPGQWTIGFMADGYEPENINVQLSAIKKNPHIDIKLSPLPESPFVAGDELYQQEKYAEAIEEYQQVLADNPDLHEAYYKIGLCYYRLDDLENSKDYFKLMLDKEPQSQNTLINISAIYFEQGDLEQGMTYFKQLDEETMTDPGTFYNIGILMFKNGQIDMAIDYFNKCLALDQNYVNGYYQLGLAYLNKGNLEEAKQNLEKVIEIAPESEMAKSAEKMLESIKKNIQ